MGTQFKYFLRRFFAFVIDAIIINAVFFIFTLIFPAWHLGLLARIFASIAVYAYYVFFESSKFQGTPGKILMELKVVNKNSGRISPMTALLRSVAKVLSWLIVAIGFIMIFFTKRNVGLHDMIAKTYVVKK